MGCDTADRPALSCQPSRFSNWSKGVQALERRTPPHGSALRASFTGVRAAFAGRILPFTEHTAPLCAALHVPNARAERDAMIVATAIEHGFTVVTRNMSDFINTGVQLLNPWPHTGAS